MVDTVVLIPHYNNIKGLVKSLASISDIEPVDVVVVDDGSKIRPDYEEFRKEFKQINKLEIIYCPANRGIEHVLNEGLRHIKELQRYKYIARLDCGDACVPERFKIQRRFLEDNPDVDLIGSWVSYEDMEGNDMYVLKYPLNHDQIKAQMFINNSILHPSAMFRVDAIDKIGYYPVNLKAAEDFAYFFEFVKKTKVANIGKVLVKCEYNPEGISVLKRRRQLISRIKIIIRNWEFKHSLTAVRGLIRSVISLLVGEKIIGKLKKVLSNK